MVVILSAMVDNSNLFKYTISVSRMYSIQNSTIYVCWDLYMLIFGDVCVQAKYRPSFFVSLDHRT